MKRKAPSLKAAVKTPVEMPIGNQAKFAGEIGRSGTSPYGDLYDISEINSKFQFPNSLTYYAEMGRTPIIAGIVQILTQAVLSDNWSIRPAEGDTSPVAEECAKALEENLRAGLEWYGKTRKHTQNFDDVQRNYCLSLTYGFAFDETVWKPMGNRAHISKLAPRLPFSVAQFVTDEENAADLLYIEQNIAGFTTKGNPRIPSDKITLISLNKEGDNFQGRSPLRALWQPYLVKDSVLRTTAQMIERNGMGIPVATADLEAPRLDPTCLAQLDAAISSWRAGENAGLRLPPGWNVEILGVNGTLPDTLPFMEYLDRLTVMGVVLPVLAAGIDGGGAYAQAQTQDALSLRAVSSFKRQLEEYQNSGYVSQWHDMNYRGRCRRPEFKYANRIDISLTQIIDTLQKLQGSQVFTGTPDDEDWIREQLNLPRRPKPVMEANPALLPKPAPMAQPGGVKAASKAWGFRPGRAPRVTEQPIALADIWERQELATAQISTEFKRAIDEMVQKALDEITMGGRAKPVKPSPAQVERIAVKLKEIADFAERDAKRELDRRSGV